MPRRRLLRAARRTHPARTHMFSPLPALALSGVKRKANAPSALAKGKRARASTTTRSFGTQTLAVRSLPKNRIGKDSGLIVSNQKVPHPKKGSAQYRRSVYGEVSSLDKVWVGGSSIGQEVTHFQTIAHAILAHYLPKMGDIRASNTQTLVGLGLPIFATYQLEYAKDAPFVGQTGQEFVTGPVLNNKSYNEMAVDLGLQMKGNSSAGLYPMAITFLAPVGGVGTNHSVLRDTNMGRHTITVSVKGTFRFQNVTPASAGDGSSASHNINAIDANPLDGKVYTFRNQAPLFSPGYVSTLTDAATLSGIELLQKVRDPFEVYGITTASGGKGGAAFTHIPAPPLNPASIWRNVSSTGRAVFPPGGFKTFTTSYLRSETIAKYCRSVSQVDYSIAAAGATDSAIYPPAGDSFMMCLRPTIKTTSEVLKVGYNVEYILKASMKRCKISPLQVVNFIE